MAEVTAQNSRPVPSGPAWRVPVSLPRQWRAADPLDRLQTAQQKIDELFGANYARSHPEVLVVVVQSAASDWAAQRLGVAIERVAEALPVEEAETHIVSALRPRP